VPKNFIKINSMKNLKVILRLVLIFYTGKLNAQVTLENIFPYESVFRINLENDGEKYATFLLDSQKLKVYNINHTIWREFSFFIPPTSEYEIFNISQNLFNEDSLLEITYGYRFSTTEGFSVFTKSENGEMLFNLDEVWSFPSFMESSLEKVKFLKIANETKLIINTHSTSSSSSGVRVYSLPQLQLEHTYNNLNSCELENDGFKFIEILFNQSLLSYSINLHNTDHSIFKTIEVAPDVPAIFQNNYFIPYIIDISQNKVNINNEIEVLLKLDYQTDLQNLIVGIDENGNNLFAPKNVGLNGSGKIIKNSNNYFLHCFISNFNGFPGGNNSTSQTVYNMPQFAVVQNYPVAKSPIYLEGIGQKLFIIDAQNATLQFYNSDDTHWKTLTMPVAPNSIVEFFNIETNYFDNDTAIEVLYRSLNNTNGILENSGRIFKEGQGNILVIDSCVYFKIDKEFGLAHKIFAWIAPFNSNGYFATNIYEWREGINRFTGIETLFKNTLENSFYLYPNPAIDFISVKNKENEISEVKIEVSDYTGKKLISKENNTILNNPDGIIDISNLPSGFYFVTIISAKNRQILKLIKN